MMNLYQTPSHAAVDLSAMSSRRSLLSMGVVAITGMALPGCNTVQPTTAGINARPLVLKVPNDPGIQPRSVASYSTVIVRDIGYDSTYTTIRRDTRYERVLFQSLSPNRFVVHARTDNGVAGSGVKYSVGYGVQESPQGYTVTFNPTHRSTYAEGLVGAFPIPNFQEEDLRRQLCSLTLLYKFEVDSPYASHVVTANFMRLAQAQSANSGWADPVTGKIYSTYYVSMVRGKKMTYVVQVYPYRNGSKAVINATVPGTETGPNEVDFGVLIKETRAMLEQIAKA